MKRLCCVLLSLFLLIGVYPFKSTKAQENQIKTEEYTWKNVQIEGGGYIPGIEFSKVEKDLIYARTDIGGIYRWLPDVGKWKPLTDWISFDEWNYLGCESIAPDPIEANKVYALVGTYTNDWTSENGAILKSNDYGENWDIIKLPFKVGGNMEGRSMGERLAIDPNNNNILYLGARSGNGLWRSMDAGETWEKVSNFTAIGSFTDDYFKDEIGVVWIEFDKASKGVSGQSESIYVGVADKNNSIYRSTDGGKTWTALANQPNGFLPHHAEISENGNLYVTYSNYAGPYNGDKGDVYRYNLATGEWKNISPVPSSSQDNYFGYGGLAIDSQNPNTIVVSALNSWWPDTIFYRSIDGGNTWNPIWDYSNGYPNRNMKYTIDISSCPWLDFGIEKELPETSPMLGWMVGDVNIDPFNSDRMLYGTGATLYATDNLTNWDKNEKITIKPMASGIEETAVLSLISLPNNAGLLSGLGDISGFKHTDLDKVPKAITNNPSLTNTTSLDYAELNSNIIVRVGTSEKESDIHFGYSKDGGNTWVEGTYKISGEKGGGNVAISSDGNTVVWSTNGADVYYSTNLGGNWTKVNGVSSGAYVVSDRVNPKKFYAFNDGKFYISIDGGQNFIESSENKLPSYLSSTFKAMPGVEGDIWLGASEGLYHSTDGGNSFEKIESIEAAYTIGFGKAKDDNSYMSLYSSGMINGKKGIYRSDDVGKSWVRINDDDHQYGNTNATITGDPNIYGRVYLGTNGRGILYADIKGDEQSGSGSGGGNDEDDKPIENPNVNISLELTNYTPQESTGNISNSFKLYNNDSNSLDLSKVKIRYYFTDDKERDYVCSAQGSISMDKSPWYVSLSQNIKGNFVDLENEIDKANKYVNITFSAGELEPGYNLDLVFSFNAIDWSIQNQNDDYSYKDINKIVLYYDNTIISGNDPLKEVDIVTLSSIANKYNTLKGSEGYSETYDLNNDGIIDLYDIVICAKTM